MSLNTGTGAISGTPATTQEATLHTVTGRGVSGSTNATVRIGVGGGDGSYVRVSRLNHARRFHVLMQLPNGKVLTAGGENATAALASAELYDPATAKWTMTGSMNVARSGGTSTAVQLSDGRVLVTGGRADVTGDLFGATVASVNAAQALKSAEIYNPATGTWSLTAPMSTARWGHTAALLPDGRVLVAGGVDRGVTTKSAELYDPATNTWTPTGDMVSPVSLHAATKVVTSGKLMVIGGLGADQLRQYKRQTWHQATGQWTEEPSRSYFGHSVMHDPALSDELMLLGGFGAPKEAGETGRDPVLDSHIRQYSPSNDTWSHGGYLYSATSPQSVPADFDARAFSSVTFVWQPNIFDRDIGWARVFMDGGVGWDGSFRNWGSAVVEFRIGASAWLPDGGVPAGSTGVGRAYTQSVYLDASKSVLSVGGMNSDCNCVVSDTWLYKVSSPDSANP
jgi:hypothetical protein